MKNKLLYNKLNTDKGVDVFLLLLMLFCVTRLSFVFIFSSISMLIVVLIAAFASFIYLLKNIIFAGRVLNYNFLFLLIYTVFVFVVSLLAKNEIYAQTASTYYKQLLILLVIWAIYNYLLFCDIRAKKIIIVWYLIGIVVSAVYTFYVALVGDEFIIRQTAYGVYDESFALMYGGYDFIYALLVLYVGILCYLHNGRANIKPLAKVFLILILIISALTIVTSGFSTAFVLIACYTIYELTKGYIRIAVFVLIFVLLIVIPDVLVYLVENIPFIPEITSSRISEMILSVTGGEKVSYIQEEGQRLDRIWWSIIIFLENPLFGGFINENSLKFGYHTEWIEQLARYGIIFSMFFYMFWYKTFRIKIINHKQDSVTLKILKRSYFMFFVLGFLNPISMLITTAPLFVLLPFMSQIFCKKNNEGENDGKIED